MSAQESLKCKEWRGVNSLPEKELDKFTLEGTEEIKTDLKDHAGWNGTKMMATLAFILGVGGQITSTILHLVGNTPDKFIEAKHIWPACRDGTFIKVKSFDLSTVTFRGSLASNYISSSNFPWSFGVESKSKPGSHHIIKPKDLLEYGADQNIFLRVLAQPWLNGTLKISAGLAAVQDITTVSNHLDFRCPLVEVFTVTVPLSPRPDTDIPIPCIPYIIDHRTDRTGEIILPSSNIVITTVHSMFSGQFKPNMKKSLWSKAVKENWGVGELCRYTTPGLETPDTADSDQESLGKTTFQPISPTQVTSNWTKLIKIKKCYISCS